MKFTREQAYLVMFYFLDSVWEIVQTDDLAVLLGSMNPYLFLDSKSADPAYWEDWERFVDKLNIDDFLNKDQVFLAIHLFLNYYQKEFGFNLSQFIKILEHGEREYINWEYKVMWESSVQRAFEKKLF